MLFMGTYTPKLDDKGRLFLPAKFRDELAEGLVVTRGQERCLYVWSMEEFGRLTERMREVPVTNKAGRDYVRMFFAGASDEKPDKQGRVTIPAQQLRDCFQPNSFLTNSAIVFERLAAVSFEREIEAPVGRSRPGRSCGSRLESAGWSRRPHPRSHGSS